jgi:hypothetical protein
MELLQSRTILLYIPALHHHERSTVALCSSKLRYSAFVKNCKQQYILQATCRLQERLHLTEQQQKPLTFPLTEASSNPTPTSVSADWNYVIITGKSQYRGSYLKHPLQVTIQIVRICMLTKCSRVLLEKLICPQLDNTFLAIQGTRRFVIALTKVHILS